MSKEWLKRLRIIVPGIIILIFLIPLFVEGFEYKQFFRKINFIQGFIFFVIFSILGSIYYVLNLRNIIFHKPIKKINDNIKNKLIAFCEHCEILPENCTLKKDKTLMHIFYKLIDNDPSLTQKSKSVMLNGLVLSTITDIIVITLGFIPIYLFTMFITMRFHLVWIAGIIFFINLLAWSIFLPKSTNLHIKLSNDQLDFIKVHYTEQVIQKLKESCKYYKNSDASNSSRNN